MIFALLVGLIIGFVLSMPPGPVGVAAIRFGLFGKLKPGVHLALGTASMDTVYCLIFIFAASAAEAAIGAISQNYPFLVFSLQFVIVLAIVLFGIINVRAKAFSMDINENNNNYKLISYLKSKGPFLLGIAIALTNIPSPTFIPTLAWIAMNVHQLKIIGNNAVNNIVFSLGFGIGNFIWLYILIRLVYHFKSKMSDLWILRLRQFAGVTLIGFGTLLGYRLFSITKWSEVIRFIFAF